MVKLTENAYRDTNIAFANELSLICDRIDVDVWDVIEIANRHPRVKILNPGLVSAAIVSPSIRGSLSMPRRMRHG